MAVWIGWQILWQFGKGEVIEEINKWLEISEREALWKK